MLPKSGRCGLGRVRQSADEPRIGGDLPYLTGYPSSLQAASQNIYSWWPVTTNASRRGTSGGVEAFAHPVGEVQA